MRKKREGNLNWSGNNTKLMEKIGELEAVIKEKALSTSGGSLKRDGKTLLVDGTPASGTPVGYTKMKTAA